MCATWRRLVGIHRKGGFRHRGLLREIGAWEIAQR